jgi:hypothetical protein
MQHKKIIIVVLTDVDIELELDIEEDDDEEDDDEIELEDDEIELEDDEIELEDEQNELKEFGYKELLYKHLKKNRYHNSTECPITYEEFEDDDEVIVTSCKHVFLRANIEGWFENHSTCPLCRKNIMQKDHNPNDPLNQNNPSNPPGIQIYAQNYNPNDPLNQNNPSNPPGIQIYAQNYNVMRIMSGMAGLAFSN